MNLQMVISRLLDCWEKVLFGLALLLCIVFCILGAMFFTDIPESRMPAGDRPTATRILPWDILSDKFFHPPIPSSANANPFAQKLVNHLTPKPVPQPSVTPPPATPKTELPQTAQEEDTHQKPQIAAVPKPDIIISVTYKGFYVDLAGAPIAFISVSNSKDNSQNRITCKKGALVAEKIMLEEMSEHSASFKTDGGETVVIPWNETHKFSFKQ